MALDSKTAVDLSTRTMNNLDTHLKRRTPAITPTDTFRLGALHGGLPLALGELRELLNSQTK